MIGVTGPDFFGVEVGHRYDVAVPLCADRLFFADGKGRIPGKTAWWLSAMGRLKPGWTVERAHVAPADAVARHHAGHASAQSTGRTMPSNS